MRPQAGGGLGARHAGGEVPGEVAGGVGGGRAGDRVEQPGVAAALGVHRGVEVVAVAAVPERPAHPGELVGRGGGVEAEPAGHQRQRQCLHLGQPQQFGVRPVQIAQSAQGDRTLQGRTRVAGGLVGVEPQPQVGVEAVSLSRVLPGRRRAANGGQQQGHPGQPGRAAAGAADGARLGGADLPYAPGERLAGQVCGGGGSGRAQVGVGEHRVPALGEQRRLGGVLGARQVGHESPASTSEVNSPYHWWSWGKPRGSRASLSRSRHN
ncbi:hypothetical protein SGRIM128S_02367 [Streptomyces griseomycini]